jgi:hypothetical protein
MMAPGKRNSKKPIKANKKAMTQKYKEPMRFSMLFTTSFYDRSVEWYWQTDRHQSRCDGL